MRRKESQGEKEEGVGKRTWKMPSKEVGNFRTKILNTNLKNREGDNM